MRRKLRTLVGTNVRALRQMRNFSQERLSELSDLHPSSVGRLERGLLNITLDSLEQIASALKVKPDILLRENVE